MSDTWTAMGASNLVSIAEPVNEGDLEAFGDSSLTKSSAPLVGV